MSRLFDTLKQFQIAFVALTLCHDNFQAWQRYHILGIVQRAIFRLLVNWSQLRYMVCTAIRLPNDGFA